MGDGQWPWPSLGGFHVVTWDEPSSSVFPEGAAKERARYPGVHTQEKGLHRGRSALTGPRPQLGAEVTTRLRGEASSTLVTRNHLSLWPKALTQLLTECDEVPTQTFNIKALEDARQLSLKGQKGH